MTRLDVMMSGNPTLRRLTLAGRIDDAAALVALIESVKAGLVVIDTGGVVFINSIGVREWLRFLRGLVATGSQIQLENVAEVLVTQMNLIPDLRLGATVVSVQAPYACERCGAEVSQLVDVAAHLEQLRALKPPAFVCPECGGTLALADYPDRYFTFLRG
jgi:DNA-directed RNA polymerase subunit RPC12/RpoP